jgi:hypothetical protein
MTEQQEVVITKKKSKEQLWKEILEKIREALSKNAENKKKLIQLGAKTLEEKEMPLYQICGAMTRKLKEIASGRYIRECLDDKYKNPVMKREPQQDHEEIAEVTSANDDKNVLDSTLESQDDSSIATTLHQEAATTTAVLQPEEVVNVAEVEETTETNVQQTPTIEEELDEREFQIRPEDYNINDLHKYSSEFKDRIIIHLDEEVTKLKQALEGVGNVE